jgi:hypothetical protein
MMEALCGVFDILSGVWFNIGAIYLPYIWGASIMNWAWAWAGAILVFWIVLGPSCFIVPWFEIPIQQLLTLVLYI